MSTLGAKKMAKELFLSNEVTNISTENKKKVLFVLGVLWGENGITTHMLTLAKGLQKDGWEVGLATKLADNSPQALEQSQRAIRLFQSSGIKYYPVDFIRINWKPQNIFNSLKSLAQLNHVIRDFHPSIMHVHSLSICPYIYPIHKFYNIPYISTCHVEPKLYVSSVKIGVKFKNITSMIAGQKVIAVSHRLREFFIETIGINEGNINSVHYGVDQEYFHPPSELERSIARQDFGLTNDQKVVCIIGRLATEKGHSTLLEALAILRSQGIDLTVLIVGQGYGTEKEDIVKVVEKLEVRDLVTFIGHSDPRKVFWASDIITLPSYENTESFGIVVAEAMLCGVVPIRTPGAGAIDQIEDTVNGYIVPFKDSDNLALRLKESFENRDKLNEMVQASIHRAQERFTSIQMTSKIIDTYTELVDPCR